MQLASIGLYTIPTISPLLPHTLLKTKKKKKNFTKPQTKISYTYSCSPAQISFLDLAFYTPNASHLNAPFAIVRMSHPPTPALSLSPPIIQSTINWKEKKIYIQKLNLKIKTFCVDYSHLPKMTIHAHRYPPIIPKKKNTIFQYSKLYKWKCLLNFFFFLNHRTWNIFNWKKRKKAQVFRVSHMFRRGRFVFITVLELGFGCNGNRVIGFLQFEHLESIRSSLLVCPKNWNSLIFVTV